MEIGQHPIVELNGADIHNCSDRNDMDVRACQVYDVGLWLVPYRIIRRGQRNPIFVRDRIWCRQTRFRE
jgi:hypothetical protein